MTRPRQRASEAALRVDAGLGLDVRRAVIVNDWNNTIVWLAPFRIVAKVRTGHVPDARLESLEREFEVAAQLAAGSRIAVNRGPAGSTTLANENQSTS